MNTLLSVLLILSTLGATGCESLFGGSCTSAGCSDSFGVSITSREGAFELGTYEITVDASGTPFTIVCSVRGLSQNSGCTAPPSPSTRVWMMMTDDSRAVESVFVHIEGTPAEVVVDIDVDGTPVLTRTFTPSYERSRPNGPDCGPVCRQAGETIEL